MKATIILDSSKEIDVLNSVAATVKALVSGTAFTAQEMVDALSVKTSDEDEKDDIERLAPRVLSNTVSNSMMGQLFLADETKSGGYIRH